MTDTVDALEWAESLVPRLAERAAQAEILRELPADTIDEVTRSGAFGLVMPVETGGWGKGLRELTGVARTLAHGCVSSGWTLSFLMLHNWFLLRSPAALRDAVLDGATWSRIPCPLAPTGTATPVDGGYRVSGRWQWATGVQHADWVMVNALLPSDGPPQARFVMAPMADVIVDDVWHTAGMRGTGSNDVVLDDVFIPEHLTVSAADFRGDNPPGGQDFDNPFVTYPLTPVLTLVAASPALGGAEAAVEHFRDLLAERVLPYSGGIRQADQGAARVRFADALSTVRAARLVWEDAIEGVCTAYDAGHRLDPRERSRFRLAAAQVVRLSRQAVTTAVEGAGASVYFLDSPLQRIQRDLETIKGHVVYDWDRAADLAGRLELGFEPEPTDMV